MSTRITLVQGDITEQRVDAIVNAANSSLLGGGGVDGAIHRAGGPQILKECRIIARERGGCEPGEAVITSAGRLSAKYVIHTVGPVWQGGNFGEEAILERAYRNSLLLAKEYNLRSVAFPSISTGAYGFPIEKASRIAVLAVRGSLHEATGIQEVRFVVFTEGDRLVYDRLLDE